MHPTRVWASFPPPSMSVSGCPSLVVTLPRPPTPSHTLPRPRAPPSTSTCFPGTRCPLCYSATRPGLALSERTLEVEVGPRGPSVSPKTCPSPFQSEPKVCLGVSPSYPSPNPPVTLRSIAARLSTRSFGLDSHLDVTRRIVETLEPFPLGVGVSESQV